MGLIIANYRRQLCVYRPPGEMDPSRLSLSPGAWANGSRREEVRAAPAQVTGGQGRQQCGRVRSSIPVPSHRTPPPGGGFKCRAQEPGCGGVRSDQHRQLRQGSGAQFSRTAAVQAFARAARTRRLLPAAATLGPPRSRRPRWKRKAGRGRAAGPRASLVPGSGGSRAPASPPAAARKLTSCVRVDQAAPASWSWARTPPSRGSGALQAYTGPSRPRSSSPTPTPPASGGPRRRPLCSPELVSSWLRRPFRKVSATGKAAAPRSRAARRGHRRTICGSWRGSGPSASSRG